jgi:hypothetical protein
MDSPDSLDPENLKETLRVGLPQLDSIPAGEYLTWGEIHIQGNTVNELQLAFSSLLGLLG